MILSEEDGIISPGRKKGYSPFLSSEASRFKKRKRQNNKQEISISLVSPTTSLEYSDDEDHPQKNSSKDSVGDSLLHSTNMSLILDDDIDDLLISSDEEVILAHPTEDIIAKN